MILITSLIKTLTEKYSCIKPELNTLAFYKRDLFSEYLNKTSFYRFILLLHPQIPAAIIEKYKSSLEWRSRFAITQNPSTSTEIIQQLAEDANCIVRTAA